MLNDSGTIVDVSRTRTVNDDRWTLYLVHTTAELLHDINEDAEKWLIHSLEYI